MLSTKVQRDEPSGHLLCHWKRDGRQLWGFGSFQPRRFCLPTSLLTSKECIMLPRPCFGWWLKVNLFTCFVEIGPVWRLLGVHFWRHRRECARCRSPASVWRQIPQGRRRWCVTSFMSRSYLSLKMMDVGKGVVKLPFWPNKFSSGVLVLLWWGLSHACSLFCASAEPSCREEIKSCNGLLATLYQQQETILSRRNVQFSLLKPFPMATWFGLVRFRSPCSCSSILLYACPEIWLFE